MKRTDKFFVISLCISVVRAVALEVIDSTPISRDYSYASGGGNRVSELVNFFDSMRDFDVYDPDIRGKQDVILTLSEAASKLHRLMDGLRLESRCNRFYKLIKRPNIRSVGSVNLLAHEVDLHYEVFQSDANLIQRISSERSYDALGRMQAIIQTLESERDPRGSSFEPIIQKELLDCVNYFVYRHQKALTGIPAYTRESLSHMSGASLSTSPSEVTLQEFRRIIGVIEMIELDEAERGSCRTFDWVNAMSDLYLYITNGRLEVPKVVQDFVTKTKRLERLTMCSELLDRIKNLEVQISESRGEEGLHQIEQRERADLIVELDKLKNIRRSLHQEGTGCPEMRKQPQTIQRDFTEFKANSSQNSTPGFPSRDHKGVMRREPESFPKNQTWVFKYINRDTIDDPPKRAIYTQHNHADQSPIEDASCASVLRDLTGTIQTLNLRSVDLDKARQLEHKINYVAINCRSVDVDNDSRSLYGHMSRWPMLSLRKRLLGWCKHKLESDLLTPTDKVVVTSIRESLRKISV